MTIPNLIFQLNNPGSGKDCITQTDAAVALPAEKVLVTEWYNSHEHSGGPAVGFWGTLRRGSRPAITGGTAAGATRSRTATRSSSPPRNSRPSYADCPDINLTRDGLSGSDLR